MNHPVEPEKRTLRVGIVPLIDCVPFIVARELGLFRRQGINVELSIERTWAGIRDKVCAGVLDAAHMLAPMPIAATLGADGVGVPMLTALLLNLNGNAITVNEALFWRMGIDGSDPVATGAALRRALDEDREAGLPPRVFAHVFPYSTHHYELRYWLAGCGIDPERDVQLVVVPPPQMVQGLSEGRIDGFCVGAPWGAYAEAAGVGRRIVQKHQIWNNSPEKVLGVTHAWAQTYPGTHQALLCAMLEACRWLDEPGNRETGARMLCDARILDVPDDIIINALQRGDGAGSQRTRLLFHSAAANFPWVSQALWFVRQMQRWGQVSDRIEAESIARESYRPDLYRVAATRLGIETPQVDYKLEGVHAGPWRLEDGGPELASDRFFDGAQFDAQASDPG